MAAKMWFNGKLVDPAQARLDFLTPALHYGIGVFEGIRSYETVDGPAIFRLEDHIERLVQSAAVLGFRSLPWSQAELQKACVTVAAESGFRECYIRPLIYLAEGGWNLTIDAGKPHCGIAAWEWKDYLGEDALEKGVRANVSSFTRHHPNVTMTKAKICGNYVSSVLAKTESLRLGFDEAIMLDAQGMVSECTGENLFVVKNGKVRTTPDSNILTGITRGSLMVLAHDLGIEIGEGPVSRDQLYMADEVFVCGTAAEVVGLREIDFRVIGQGHSGPITSALQQAYKALVRGEHPRSKKWLTKVGAPRMAKVAAAR
jgi:branched-chain amino acid aminotransferase